MDETSLLGVSVRERALYAELLAVYRDLLAALDDGSADAASLADRRARADAVTQELRGVADTLASHRLSGEAVPASVRALWAASAETAAEALGLNAALAERARAGTAAVAAALARLRRGRTGLAGYRPTGSSVARIADRHA